MELLHIIWKTRSCSNSTEPKLLEVRREVSTVNDDLGCHVISSAVFVSVFYQVQSQRSYNTLAVAWIDCLMLNQTDTVIHAKGAPTTY